MSEPGEVVSINGPKKVNIERLETILADYKAGNIDAIAVVTGSMSAKYDALFLDSPPLSHAGRTVFYGLHFLANALLETLG